MSMRSAIGLVLAAVGGFYLLVGLGIGWAIWG